MSQAAGPIDASKILQAFGIGPERKVRKAVITMEAGQLVTIQLEEFVQPYNVIGDALEVVASQYELVLREPTLDERREEAAYYNSLQPWELK